MRQARNEAIEIAERYTDLAEVEQFYWFTREETSFSIVGPSEIVRALEKGYLLEIQEPTVIRDASVLVALNSALEQNGMLNIPTGFVRRHPDTTDKTTPGLSSTKGLIPVTPKTLIV